VIADPETIHLDGNSLGRLPLATRDRIRAVTEQWGEELIAGWDEWIGLPSRAGDLLATGILGARPGEVLVCDSTTVNLYKLCAATLDAYRLSAQRAIVTDRGNFPTDRYVLEGLCHERNLELRRFDADPLRGPQPEDLEPVLADGAAALVVLSHVAYRSGALADLRAITDIARRHDAHVVWDLSHSVGAVPVELSAAGVELAVGCSYKYLNGGPGAPAWLYVAEAIQPRLRSPIWGWFGQEDQFAMDRDYTPVAGVGRFAAGTPSVLGIAAVEEGARIVAEAGIERLREKSLALTDLMIQLHDAWLAPLGFELGTPREPERRGSHLALRHPEASTICRALIERARVIADFRGPDIIRLAAAPLSTRYADVWDALDRLRALVAAGEHRLADAATRPG
jgi:kynureninase